MFGDYKRGSGIVTWPLWVSPCPDIELTRRVTVIRGQWRDNLYAVVAACRLSNSFMETVSVVPTVSTHCRCIASFRCVNPSAHDTVWTSTLSLGRHGNVWSQSPLHSQSTTRRNGATGKRDHLLHRLQTATMWLQHVSVALWDLTGTARSRSMHKGLMNLIQPGSVCALSRLGQQS